jgi:predicted RNA-binding Zn-ribbon protein involved in translation (DUF1610 family)
MTTKIAMGAAEKVWFCQSCEEVIEDPVTLYQCGECGTVFSRDTSANGTSPAPPRTCR